MQEAGIGVATGMGMSLSPPSLGSATRREDGPEKKRIAAAALHGPSVSVIIPTYNYGSYLPRAIESCLVQTYGTAEIIVVDDGSTDETERIVRDKGRDIRYVFQENSGVSSARNRGLGLATGEFIIFLDADDYLTRDAMETRMSAMETPDIDFVLTPTYSKNGAGDLLKDDPRSDEHFVSDVMDRMLLERRIPFATCAVLVRSKVAKRFMFPVNLSNGEDIAYFTKIFFRRRGAFLDRPTAVTLSHPDSLRHHMEEIERQGNALVDTIFDDPYYGGALDYLRRDFTAYRNLEFFRRFYRSGQRRAARRCFAKAVSMKPRTLLKVEYLIKLLRLSFGLPAAKNQWVHPQSFPLRSLPASPSHDRR